MGAQLILRVKNGRLAAILVAALLPACGGGSGGGGSSGTIRGVVSDGPIIGATINCYQVDITGQPTGPAINTTDILTDGNGRFTITTSTNITGPLTCESTGGTDTVSMTPAPDLSVLTPDSVTAGDSVTANLTPLTTVATRIVQNGGTATPQEITNTLTSVATAFGLTDVDLLTLPPDPASSDQQEVKYQQILDNLSSIVASDLSFTFTALIDALVTDLADDHVLDGLDGSPDNPVFIDSTPLDQVPTFQPLLDTVIEMAFEPNISQPSNNSVSMVRNPTKSMAGVLAIDIKANTINASVFGAAFDVYIEKSNITQWNGSGTMTCTEDTLTGCEPGDFLEQFPPVNYIVGLQQGTPSTLLVGATQISPSSGTTVGTGGTIVTLKFAKVCDCSESSQLGFPYNANIPCDPNDPSIDCNTLLDSSLNDINVSWSGGKITTINFPPIPSS